MNYIDLSICLICVPPPVGEPDGQVRGAAAPGAAERVERPATPPNKKHEINTIELENNQTHKANIVIIIITTTYKQLNQQAQLNISTDITNKETRDPPPCGRAGGRAGGDSSSAQRAQAARRVHMNCYIK